MDAPSVCAVCGSVGFLLDKVPLFPFALGVALGVLVGDLLPALRQHLAEEVNRALSSMPWRAPAEAGPDPPTGRSTVQDDRASPPPAKTEEAAQDGDKQKRSRRPALAAPSCPPGEAWPGARDAAPGL